MMIISKWLNWVFCKVLNTNCNQKLFHNFLGVFSKFPNQACSFCIKLLMFLLQPRREKGDMAPSPGRSGQLQLRQSRQDVQGRRRRLDLLCHAVLPLLHRVVGSLRQDWRQDSHRRRRSNHENLATSNSG